MNGAAGSRTGRRLRWAAGIVAVLAAGSLGWWLLHPRDYYATPPALHYGPAGPAQPQLIMLTVSAESQPPPDRTGRVATRRWDLTGAHLGARLSPAYTEDVWRDTDGRLVDRCRGRIRVTSDDQERNFVNTLPGTPTALNAGPDGGYPIVRKLVGLWRDVRFPPAAQVAALQALARLPGIAYQDVVRDRAGRPGFAFSVDEVTVSGTAPRVRALLVFSPTTGALEDYEEIVLDPEGAPVHTGDVLDYTLFL